MREHKAPDGPAPTPMIESVREAFLAALAEMKPEDLSGWGKANPNQFFATLLKLIPETELRGVDFAEVSETPISEAEWASRARD
jgi:hypothetical protein